jgi:hypothetical protein
MMAVSAVIAGRYNFFYSGANSSSMKRVYTVEEILGSLRSKAACSRKREVPHAHLSKTLAVRAI